MTVGGGFRRLTRVLRRLEDAGWTIERVRATDDAGFQATDPLEAMVRCRFSDGNPAPPDVENLELGDQPVDIHSDRIETTAHGVTVELSVTVDLPEAPSGIPCRTEDTIATPLHKDVDLLETLYQSHRTFADMADAVDVDVSAETIRRYVIDHDIHEPGTRSITADAHHEAHPLLADGMGLASDTRVDDLIEAVATANTVYDVQRHLDLDRDQTASMLRDLGLMDLVLGRLDDVDSREEREQEIRRRLASHETTPPA